MRSASSNKVVLTEVTWSSRTTHCNTTTITSTTTTTIAATVTTNKGSYRRGIRKSEKSCWWLQWLPLPLLLPIQPLMLLPPRPTSPPPLSLLLLPLSTFCHCCRRRHRHRHHHRRFHRYHRHSSQATNRFFSTGIADFIGNPHLPFETWQICSAMYTSSLVWMIFTFSKIIDLMPAVIRGDPFYPTLEKIIYC